MYGGYNGAQCQALTEIMNTLNSTSDRDPTDLDKNFLEQLLDYFVIAVDKLTLLRSKSLTSLRLSIQSIVK